MNKSLWDEWRESPVTLEVFRAMERHHAEQAVLGLADALVMDSVEQTALRVAEHAGYLRGLKAIIDGDFVDDE